MRWGMSGRAVVWAVLYLMAALVGRATRPEGSPLALVWPAAGIAVLWLLLTLGRARLASVLALLALGLAINVGTGSSPVVGMLLAAANVVHALTAVAVLERLQAHGPPRLAETNDLFRLVAAAVAGATASAPFGVSVLLLGHDDAPLAVALGSWVLRYAAITILIVAVPLAWRATGWRRRMEGGRLAETVAAMAMAVAVYIAVFATPPGQPTAFLVVPIGVWVGIRLGPFWSAVHGLVAVAVCVAATQLDLGPFGAFDDPLTRSVTVQSFIAITGLVSLSLSLAVEDRRRALDNVARGRLELQHILDSALLGHAVLALERPHLGRITYANRALAAWATGSHDDLPASWPDMVDPEDRPQALLALAKLSAGYHTWHGELRHQTANGPRWCEVALALLPATEERGRPARAYLQVLDITDRRDLEARLRHQAMHDGLTGLPNRMLLHDRLEHALAASRRSGARVALIFLDLDRFKDVNDTLGHAIGDTVIAEVARRLQHAVRPGDTVARLGGDEFVVCCADLADAEQARQIAGRLLDAVSRPLVIEGHRLHLTVSAGFAVGGADTESATLLRQADTAMYEAKGHGRARVVSAHLPSPMG